MGTANPKPSESMNNVIRTKATLARRILERWGVTQSAPAYRTA
jgi:hypothetical protein